MYIPVRDPLHVCELLVLVQESVQVPLAREVLESSERERLCRSVRAHAEHKLEVDKVLAKGRKLNKRLLALV